MIELHISITNPPPSPWWKHMASVRWQVKTWESFFAGPGRSQNCNDSKSMVAHVDLPSSDSLASRTVSSSEGTSWPSSVKSTLTTFSSRVMFVSIKRFPSRSLVIWWDVMGPLDLPEQLLEKKEMWNSLSWGTFASPTGSTQYILGSHECKIDSSHPIESMGMFHLYHVHQPVSSQCPHSWSSPRLLKPSPSWGRHPSAAKMWGSG